MRYGITSVLVIFWIAVVAAADTAPYYLKVTAQNGDGIYSLLRRYQLIDHSCNLQFFLLENNLDENDILFVGKQYKLPVLIYRYNGRSIRSTIGKDDWNKAVRIKRYNEDILRAGLRQMDYQSSRILWVPNHEINCTGEQNRPADQMEAEAGPNPGTTTSDRNTKPVNYKSVTMPVFGKNYEEVAIKSNVLANKVYYLEPGHGGPDPGAMAHNVHGKYTLCEDEYAYDVTLRLARKLIENGAIVHLVVEDPKDGIRDQMYLPCDNDELSMGRDPIPINQKLRLRQRTAEINKLHTKYKRQGIVDQYVLSIHVDSRSANVRQDVFFYYYSESNSGKQLANSLQETFHQKYIQYQGKERGYGGTVTSRPLFILKYSWPTAVFVELANIRNAEDRKRILEPTNRQLLAEWLYEGLTR
jgi:N-acetylmuramoyl-L-alanine amidase